MKSTHTSMKTQCEIREGIGLCDSCLLPKWPQGYVGNGDMVCMDCLDKFYKKAVKTIRHKLKGKSTMKTQSYKRAGTSKKRAKEYNIYRVRRQKFLETHDTCFVCERWIRPQNRDAHHFRGRAGSLYLDERFWKMCCRDCHTNIHENPKWAVKMGFLAGPGEWNKVPR